PEFFRIAKSRLAGDGVFCQWIQLYQLPLPVVAGIVRSIREVFPHVNVWFGGTADLLVLGSTRPLNYDRKWLARLIGSGGPLHGIATEWLSIDSPDEYFGRPLLAETGVTRLVGRAEFVHTDDRPRLEFVAARRFLDPTSDVYAVFDSLLAIGRGDSGIAPFARTSVLAARRSDAGLLPYLDAAQHAQPSAEEWPVRAPAPKARFVTPSLENFSRRRWAQWHWRRPPGSPTVFSATLWKGVRDQRVTASLRRRQRCVPVGARRQRPRSSS